MILVERIRFFNIRNWLILIFVFFCHNIFAYNQEKNLVINVKNHGVRGDGRSDDTYAIQELLNSFVGSRVTFLFPRGNYKISNKLIIKSDNVVIKGENDATLDFLTTNCNIGSDGYCYCDLGIHISSNVRNITVQNIRIKSRTTNQIVSYGISVWDFAENVSIKNCILDGFTGGILFNRLNRNLVCEGNVFRNMTFVPKAKAGGYGIVYQSSINTMTNKNVFENTVYRHALYYARNQRYPESGYDHRFFDNTVYGSVDKEYLTGYELSFKILGNSNFMIENNSFVGGVGHIWITKNKSGEKPNPDNITIRNNLFKSIKNNPISKVYAIGADEGANTSNLRIEHNNFIDNNVDFLIKVQEGNKVYIIDNIVRNIVGHFLFVECGVNDLKVSGNEISGLKYGYNAIILGERGKGTFSSSISIMNNTIKSQGNGIVANTLVTGVIKDNRFYVNNTGILFTEMKFTGDISNNRFYKSKRTIFDISRNISIRTKGNFLNDKALR